MIANRPVKPTITSHPATLEQIRVLPCGVALMLFLIAFIIPFPNQVSSAVANQVSSAASPAADEYDVARNICIKDESLDKGILLTEPNSQGPPISLGCKLRDCSPPGPIEMQIRLRGDSVVDSVRIEFTNLPSAIKSLIKEATGTPVISRDGSIHIPREMQVSLQIPKELITDGTSVHKNLTIKVTLLLNKPLLQKHRGSPEFNQLQRHNWTAKLEIDQLKGQVVVNEFRALYAIRWCLSSSQPPPGPHSFDQIKLLAAKGSIKEATLMISGRSQSECLKYTPLQGTDSLLVGNMLSKSTDCQLNEIVIFSKDRAMHIATPDPPWTDAGGDVRKIRLPDKPLQLPVKFWILHKPEGKEISDLKNDLLSQLEMANELFGPENECGIQFVATKDSFRDMTEEAKKKKLSDFFCDKAEVDAATLREFDEHWRDLRAINVYFVSQDPTHKGSHCPSGIFLSRDSKPETLAHEFGHALGLEDALPKRVDLPRIGDIKKWASTQKNLMFSGGTGRSELTKGQCFRCYMNKTSSVRMLEILPKNDARECKDHDPQNDCIDIGETVTNPQ